MKYKTTDKIMLITIIVLALPFIIIGFQMLIGNTPPALEYYLQNQ